MDKNVVFTELDKLFDNEQIETPSKIGKKINYCLYSEGTAILKEETFKLDVANIINQIMNGDMLISDIEKKYMEYEKNNYDALELGIDAKNLLSSTNIILNNKTSYQNNLNNNDQTQIKLTNEEYGVLKNLDAIKNTYQIYSVVMQTFAITTTSLAVISWAVAGYYWLCWRMFGANIPFAVAATAQAISLSASSAVGWVSYESFKDEVNNLNNINEYKKNIYWETSKIFVHEAGYWSASKFLIQPVLKGLLSQAASKIIYQLPAFSSSQLTLLYCAYSVSLASSWATALYNAINVVSTAITVMSVIASMIKEIVLFNLYE